MAQWLNFTLDISDAIRAPCYVSPRRLPYFNELLTSYNLCVTEFAQRPLPDLPNIPVYAECLKAINTSLSQPNFASQTLLDLTRYATDFLTNDFVDRSGHSNSSRVDLLSLWNKLTLFS